MTPLEEYAVLPFYLRMMGTNAPGSLAHDDGLWTDLVEAGRTISASDTRSMLRSGNENWRPVVMGAWFSTRFDAAEIGEALRDAMVASYGSLTAPPLAAACVCVLDGTARDDLDAFVRRDPGRDGSREVVAAALEHVGGAYPNDVDGGDRQRFHDLLAVAQRLRAALR